MFADADETRSVALQSSSPQFAEWAAAVGNSIAILGFCELGDAGEADLHARFRAAPGARDSPRRHRGDGLLLEFGELTRRVALDGAELILAPVNWPLFPRPEGERPGEVITAMSTARTNKVAVAACDDCGVERGQQWTAGTALVDPDGWVVTAAGDGVGMAFVDIELSRTHDKSLTEYADVLGDRRVDLS